MGYLFSDSRTLALNVQLPAYVPLVELTVVFKGAPIGPNGIEVGDRDLNRFALAGFQDFLDLEAIDGEPVLFLGVVGDGQFQRVQSSFLVQNDRRGNIVADVLLAEDREIKFFRLAAQHIRVRCIGSVSDSYQHEQSGQRHNHRFPSHVMPSSGLVDPVSALSSNSHRGGNATSVTLFSLSI